MTPERYQRINALADAALDLPPAERAAYLDRACGSDPHLREQVQHLVDAHSTDDDFLEAPALEVLAKDLAGASAPHNLGGRQIRQYRVISRLGAGGIGEVWLARDTQLTREVALKLLSPQFAGDPYHVRRFRLEARAASTLNHPNIVTIYEIGRADGVDFIAQEFVQGETLRQRLANGRIQLREVLKIGVQITSALEAAHKAGIVHRDIKPENVMIRPDGLVKVLDFGLARFIERVPPAGEGESIAQSLATGPGFVLGTVRYMSPEQARGQPVDSRSDLFSLGVLLYEMATDVAPFSGPTPADVLAAILTSDPPPASRHAPDLPPEFERLLRRCLEKDPQARCATAADLGAEMGFLARSLESHDSAKFPPMARHRPSPRWMLGGAVAALAILLLAVFATFVRKEPNTAGPLQIEQLNLGGDAAGATISPDGKYAAYILNEPGGQSVWNMQLATASRIRLMPPESGAHSGLAFSADGSFLYFLRRQGAEANTLYRLTMLGGQPVKLLEDVGEAFSVSPDGKRVAFVRMDRPREESALMVGGFDGAAVRPLAVRHLPQYFSLYGVAWSPNQSSIAAFAGENAATAQQFHLVQVRLGDGAVRPIGNHTWRWVLNLVWPAKGKALAFIATEQLANYQIWTAPVSGGEATRITNDVSDYSGLSATADGRTLLALQTQMFADLWVAPARDYNAAVQITSGPIHEFNTLAWTPDGRIVYSALVGDDGEIWITDADGHNLRQLANGPGDKNEMAISRDHVTSSISRWDTSGAWTSTAVTRGSLRTVFWKSTPSRLPMAYRFSMRRSTIGPPDWEASPLSGKYRWMAAIPCK